jgi:hypothetical protein
MDKYIKINSVQGGDFKSSQNLVDFTVPSSMGVVNLRDSYVNLNVKVNVVESNTDAGVGVYCAGVQWKKGTNTHNPHFTNSAIVKNCNIKSALKGQIENIRRIDQLSQLLATYGRTLAEQQSYSYLNANQIVNPINKQHWTIYREINKTGSAISRDLDICPVQISLADLFDFCKAGQEVDLSKMGDMRLHLELNVDKLEPVQRMTTDDELADKNLKNMQNVITVGDTNQVESFCLYTNGLGLSPFYVGQKVKINATHTDGGASNISDETRIITSITHDVNGSLGGRKGALLITFNNSWGNLVAGKQYTDVTLTPESFDLNASTIEINMAEIVIKRVGNPAGVSQIAYDTFSTEQTNGNGLNSFQSQYQVEPDATNLLIMFPDEQTDIISHNPNINSFRLRINNEDCTDREIQKYSPLYYDRLNMTMGSMGFRLKNLTENYGISNENDYGQVYDGFYSGTQSLLIANPLFQTDREKFVQVNIESGGSGVRKMTIFKQRPRVLEL